MKKSGSRESPPSKSGLRESQPSKSGPRKSPPRKSPPRKSPPRKSPSRKSPRQESGSQKGQSPSQLIDAKIQEWGDWRGEMLSRLRALVKEADPDVVEELKWRGVPVWSHDGLICTGEAYKSVVT